MDQKYYKKTLLIPAASAAEAEQKFQILMKGKEEQKTIAEKWEPVLTVIGNAIVKTFLDNYDKSKPLKK
jgi:hypothetical protein